MTATIAVRPSRDRHSLGNDERPHLVRWDRSWSQFRYHPHIGTRSLSSGKANETLEGDTSGLKGLGDGFLVIGNGRLIEQAVLLEEAA